MDSSAQYQSQPAVTPASQQPQVVQSTPNSWLNWKNILLLLSVLLVVGFIWSLINSPLLVTVQGTGRVSVPAEKVSFTVTFTGIADIPSQAVNQANNKYDIIRNLLIDAGVPSNEISDSSIQVVPNAQLAAGASGYQAIRAISVTMPYQLADDFFMARLYETGATVVSALTPLAGESNEVLEEQALKEAISEAKEEANKVAKRRLKLIKKMVSFAQASQQTTLSSKQEAASTNGQMSSDTVEIVKTVSVTYKMW